MIPFDVLSPLGLEYIRDNLPQARDELTNEIDKPVQAARDALRAFEKARGEDLDAQGRVWWTLHHYPMLSERQVAKVLGVSPGLVNRYSHRRKKKVEFLATVAAEGTCHARE